MNLITYFIYVMMLLIILVSADVTYRLILHERSKEMGVMRVIGFYGNDMRLIMLTEIIVLGFIAMLVGFLLASLPSWAVSSIDFSWFPGFEIFLKDDKLAALYKPFTMLINIVLLICILVILSLRQSFRVVRKELPGLLSGEAL
jgi:ABC-type antimicrobial peptide transport system permease subunit